LFKMRPGDFALGQAIKSKLISFSETVSPLPGITSQRSIDCLVEQILDSIRRINYVAVIREKEWSQVVTDPTNDAFDPLKAAAWHAQKGDYNEAFWLVFLITHFGKNKDTGWALVREVYKGDELTGTWTWTNTSTSYSEFRTWLDQNKVRIKLIGKFGNHRKYESLDALSSRGTGIAIGSYIDWIGDSHDHKIFIENAINQGGNDPKLLFNYLYISMSDVVRFGRTAKFDYLTMIGKLKLVNIIPDSTYLTEATGPLDGAKLLFGRNLNTSQLGRKMSDLNDYLGLFFGMQVLEDALCNWQKSPEEYRHFRG